MTFGLGYGPDLLRDSGIRSERIQLIGDGAKSPLWRQIVADMMTTPVVYTTHSEAAVLGGAFRLHGGTPDKAILAPTLSRFAHVA